MPNSVQKVIQAASSALKGLDSFLLSNPLGKGEGVLGEFERTIRSDALIDESEPVIGVYANSPHDFLIFTIYGIHCIERKSKTTILYKLIDQVEEPTEVDEHLDLRLHSGDFVSIPVLNATDEVPDIYAVYEFLSLLGNSHSIPSDRLGDVDSKGTLLEYVDDHFRNAPHRAQIYDWLLPDSILDYWFAELKIGKNKRNQAELWRLIGLILSLSFSEQARLKEDKERQRRSDN